MIKLVMEASRIMVLWLISIGVAILAAIFTTFYAWRRTKVLNAKFNALVIRLEEMVKNPTAEQEKKESIYLLKQGFQWGKKQRLKKTAWFSLLFPVIVFFLVLSVAHVFTKYPYMFLGLYPIPVLFAGALLCVVYLVDSGASHVLPSGSGSEEELWRSVIFPSVPPGGELDIVLSSLNPGLIFEDWFIKYLVWLQTKKQVKVRIISGSPVSQWMGGIQRTRWETLVKDIIKKGLIRSMRIAPQSPLPQFIVTDDLVRIEKTDIRLFDVSRIERLRMRFETLWCNATPALETPFFQIEEASR